MHEEFAGGNGLQWNMCDFDYAPRRQLRIHPNQATGETQNREKHANLQYAERHDISSKAHQDDRNDAGEKEW